MSELVRWSLEDHLGRKGSGRNEVLSPRRIRNRKRRNKGGWHPIPRRRCSPWPWAILPGSSTIDSGSDRPLLRVDQNVNRISHLLNNSGFFPISYYPFAGFRRWNNKGGASALPFHRPRKCWPCWRKSFGTGRKPICIEKQHSQRCHVINWIKRNSPKKKKMRMKAARRLCSKGKLTHQLIFCTTYFSPGRWAKAKWFQPTKELPSPLYFEMEEI